MHLLDINVGVWHTITERRINGPLQIIHLMCYAHFCQEIVGSSFTHLDSIKLLCTIRFEGQSLL